MRRRLPIAVPFLLLVAACAAQQHLVPAESYGADVAWLADDAREGRDTGSPGLQATAQWVAQRFEQSGLQPLGDDGGWEQHFQAKGARRLIDGNELVLGDQALELYEDWMPLQTAVTGSADGALVFAGYGITDAEGGWDDYAGLDVQGRIVVVLRKGPHSDEEGTRYAEGSDARDRYLSFSGKVNAAFRHGAAALLVVNDPAHTGEGLDRDRPQPYRSLGDEPSAVSASLPAASLTLAAAGAALGLDFAALQQEMETGGRPVTRVLEGQTARLQVRSELELVDTANVLGFLPGNDPALAGQYVLIGAHMDHLGLGEHSGSLGGRRARGQIHNGADDNASGTAGVVEAAALLGARAGELRRGVVFAAWSGEEWGLLGSRHYVEDPKLPLTDLVAVVNMDMIGRSKDGYLAVEGTGSGEGFGPLVIGAQDELGLHLDLHLAERPSNNSDQWPFFEQDIPVLAFFTGLHDDYHKPSDDAALVNAEGGAQISSLAAEVVRQLARADSRPLFVKAAPPSAVAAAPADPHAAGNPGDTSTFQPYRVVLGTSPDMAYQEDDGVRLSGVREGTPAEKAGLQAGDIIVAFDDKPVRNLEDYSVLLFSHKAGDTVRVKVRRGDQTLELSAVLAGRDGEN
jgi:hypothetical protein